MNYLSRKLEHSPALVRVLPFVIFVGLTFLQGKLGSASTYWVYGLKTVVGGSLILLLRPLITEMKWRFSWEGVATGVAVFAMWVGIDGWYPKLTIGGSVWNPFQQFGQDSALASSLVAVRIAGSSLIVPLLEEVFYRSFVYRYLVNPDFQSVALGQFRWMPFLVTSALFAVEHSQWLAGLLCGFAYQGLVCRKNRLGDAMTAHAVTNFLLGVWVVWKGAWQFW